MDASLISGCQDTSEKLNRKRDGNVDYQGDYNSALQFVQGN